MASLVPYAAGEGPDLLTAMLPMLYKDSKWAARRIGRGVKRGARYLKTRRSAKRRKVSQPKVGEPMRLSHVKRDDTFTQDALLIDTRTLYVNELTAIPGGPLEDDRERTLINVKGIELTYHFANKDGQPHFLNVAVVAPKHTSSGVTVTDFFRGASGNRGTDFAITMSALELHYTPINTDKYTIIRHTRHQLGAQQDAVALYNSDAGPGNWLSKKQWIPINRQLRYDSQLSTSCNTPIYLVYWFDRMMATGGSAVAASTEQCSFMHSMFYTDVL